MSEAIISVENLGKRYSIRHQGDRQRYVALRDVIAQKAAAPFRFLRGDRRSKIEDRRGNHNPLTTNSDLLSSRAAPRASREDFWALKDVSFEVRRGEVVGIIGRNGAGKSTLLKILSRITEPTEGRVRIGGRVASLLEVGTGFHPELTGRENIFLNGAILGMTKAEIKRKFDEIVDFAEIEKFLDTPVKRYSSGMYVRLAFAVAAHLEPEILIVDEVLAVGDAEFQKKCLGKMESVSKREGRTILFVSHDMSAVKRLCSRALLLRDGRIILDDQAENAVAAYLVGDQDASLTTISLRDYRDRSGDGSARIIEASLLNEKMEQCNRFAVGDDILIEYRVEYVTESHRFSHSIEISNSDGLPIYHLWDIDNGQADPISAHGQLIRARLSIDLFPDRYFVSCWVGDAKGARADRVANCLSFVIEQSNDRIPRVLSKQKGLVYKTAQWSYEPACGGT